MKIKKIIRNLLIFVFLGVLALFVIFIIIENLLNVTEQQEMVNLSLKTESREELSEYLSGKRQADYETGESSMGRDTDEILQEDNLDCEDDPMCQNLYDSHGNLLWKGLSREKMKNADGKTKKSFAAAYEKYCTDKEEVTQESILTIEAIGTKYDRLTMLCTKYNESIPYGENGYSYYKGYYKEKKCDNTPYIKKGIPGNGLCGLGYVTWVYRNILGKTPDALYDKQLDKEHLTLIKLKKIKTGDLCIEETSNGVRYGVVIGKYKGLHIVSMCDCIPRKNFPTGVNHYTYIYEETKNSLGSYFPVSFTGYYRLPEMED